jgi:hypothetical protein
MVAQARCTGIVSLGGLMQCLLQRSNSTTLLTLQQSYYTARAQAHTPSYTRSLPHTDAHSLLLLPPLLLLLRSRRLQPSRLLPCRTNALPDAHCSTTAADTFYWVAARWIQASTDDMVRSTVWIVRVGAIWREAIISPRASPSQPAKVFRLYIVDVFAPVIVTIAVVPTDCH